MKEASLAAHFIPQQVRHWLSSPTTLETWVNSSYHTTHACGIFIMAPIKLCLVVPGVFITSIHLYVQLMDDLVGALLP